MQIVTIGLAGETYGIEIAHIKEIIMDREPTRVPNLPPFLKGIINLRSKVIPIVEGTERLGYNRQASSESDRGNIVIVSYRDQLIGIRVDTAHTVITIDEDTVQSSPEMIDEMGGRFVKGVVEASLDKSTKSQEEIKKSSGVLSASFEDTTTESDTTEEDNAQKSNIMLLDLDELFTGEEIEKIGRTREDAEV